MVEVELKGGQGRGVRRCGALGMVVMVRSGFSHAARGLEKERVRWGVSTDEFIGIFVCAVGVAVVRRGGLRRGWWRWLR